MEPLNQNPEEVPQNDAAPQTTVIQNNKTVEDVKDFIKTKLLAIIKKIIAQPTNGSYDVFSTPDKNKLTNAISLLGLGFVTTLILLYFTTPSSMRSYIEFSVFIKASLVVTIILFLISVFTFIVKLTTGSKISFGEELLTGGICTIPIILFLILFFIISIVASDRSLNLIEGGYSNILSSGSFIAIAAVIYLFLYLVTIIQQSLKSSKVNDAFNWYVSPLIIVIAIYLGEKIGEALFK